ncbi:hypothetical protein MELE44368_13145 [Mycolicibacterium elephantis DSM 44368]|uniref:FAD-dependent oxidoreductase 2 FAD-binding domain-containing protein n=1 Tax=Mycolicibacterium elephantis DSM 44368 TaxID=1335622 RepID=A0A439DXZ5_9MYCO|nr:hypothetical protein MELE44368_13145 [Mycolicibacterium elephantis DSM 44368]
MGSGAGGLTAAITVAEHGGRAIVVEKDSCLGGVTALSVGQIWLGANSLAAEAGIADSVDDAVAYLDFLAGDLGDRELRRRYIEDGSEAIDFLYQKIGIQLSVIRRHPDYWYPKGTGSKAEGRYLEVATYDREQLGPLAEKFRKVNPYGTDLINTADVVEADLDASKIEEAIRIHQKRDELCGGAALAASLVAAAAARGVQLRTDTRAVRIVTDGEGRVAGVEVEDPQGSAVIPTRAVLLATGGYDWNPGFVQTFEHKPSLPSMAPRTIEGDHLMMASEIGGWVDSGRPSSTPLNLGFQVPGAEYDGKPLYENMASLRPGAIIVNARGKRFADESFYPDVNGAYNNFDGGEQRMSNSPAWLVFDAKYLRNYGFQTYQTLRPGEALPGGVGNVGKDLPELAVAAGIDASGLVETVERFNAFCAQGVDEDFGRGTIPWSRMYMGDLRVQPNPLLGPLTEGPFYAIKLTPVGTSIVSAGLKVDAAGRVLNARGGTVPGLYAAGNAAARSDVVGYQSGIANMKGIQLGYVAGRDIMKA